VYCELLDKKLPLCGVSDGSRLNSLQQLFDKANGRNKTVKLQVGESSRRLILVKLLI